MACSGTPLLYFTYNEPDIMKVFKLDRLRWLGHIFIMHEQNPCRKVTLHKPEDTRRDCRPATGWLDSIEEDIKIMGVRNWRRKTGSGPMEGNRGGCQG
jgi:hypothetical protein